MCHEKFNLIHAIFALGMKSAVVGPDDVDPDVAVYIQDRLRRSNGRGTNLYVYSMLHFATLLILERSDLFS